MAILKVTNLESLKAYWADIALKHKEIDGFKWGDEDVIYHDNRSGLPAKFLWGYPYESVRYGDNRSDNVNKQKEARADFMKVQTSKKFSDIEADLEFCESVIDDIVSKILLDKRGSLVDNEWVMLAVNMAQAKGAAVQKMFGSTQYIGWSLIIPILDNKNFNYDATKWE